MDLAYQRLEENTRPHEECRSGGKHRRRTCLVRAAVGAAALLIVGTCLMSCGSSAAPAVQTAPTAEPDRAPARQQYTGQTPQQVFHPMEHRAGNLVEETRAIIQAIPSPVSRIEESSTDTSSAEAFADSAVTLTNGYKIQIYVSPNREQAERAAVRARMNFPADSIYVVFQAPFHKVRVGHFETQQEAEEKVREAENKGYRNPLWFPPSQ